MARTRLGEASSLSLCSESVARLINAHHTNGSNASVLREQTHPTHAMRASLTTTTYPLGGMGRRPLLPRT
jgi:hypothetical protein